MAVAAQLVPRCITRRQCRFRHAEGLDARALVEEEKRRSAASFGEVLKELEAPVMSAVEATLDPARVVLRLVGRSRASAVR